MSEAAALGMESTYLQRREIFFAGSRYGSRRSRVFSGEFLTSKSWLWFNGSIIIKGYIETLVGLGNGVERFRLDFRNWGTLLAVTLVGRREGSLSGVYGSVGHQGGAPFCRHSEGLASHGGSGRGSSVGVGDAVSAASRTDRHFLEALCSGTLLATAGTSPGGRGPFFTSA